MPAAQTAAQLTEFERRGAGTNSERLAALWLSQETESPHREATLETFWCRPNWALAHSWHALLAIAVLSFSRGMQRLFEQTWELKPLSVRNTANNLLWIGVLGCYTAVSWGIHALVDRGRLQIASNLLLLPASAAFLALSGWLLSAKRITRARLSPFAILGAVLLAIYLTGAGVYLPHLFSSYASRYGVIGAVLAMISSLFASMVVLVASASVAREVSEELDRIRRGERPPDDEIKQEWDALLDELRVRWQTLREQIDRRRNKHPQHDR